MVRNAQLNLRVKPALKAKLERLAKEDRRTLSAYVKKLLEDHVESASQVSVKEQKQKVRRIFERLVKKQAK
jgi:predicted DNA-binding protein